MSYKEDFELVFGSEKECHRMMLPYRTAIKTVKTKLESLDDEMKCAFEHSPIHNIKSRVKTPESIIEKLYRKEYEVSKDGLRQLTDIAGIRVICKYVDDIYYIAQLLLLHDDITLVKKNKLYSISKR